MLNIAKIDSNRRSKNVKNQIYLSFFLRGLSIFLSFFVVRMTIGYLGNELYGIWIVLLSIISWLSLFDVGVGNGLRNKLAVALSNDNFIEARSYITTAYAVLTGIGLVLSVLFGIATYFIDWASIFNSNVLNIDEYRLMMFLFLFSILLSFVLGLINSILNAYQQAALTNIIPILVNLLFIFCLKSFKSLFLSDIISIVIAYSLVLILANVSVTFYFFAKNKKVIPQIDFFSKFKIREILSLGGSFFVIQIAVLLIFTVDNYIILQTLGLEQVTTYNVVFKLYSVFTVAFGIIISPMWSAFTEANEKKDIKWMKMILRKLNVIFLIVLMGLLIMSQVYQDILNIWLPIENRVTPSFNLIISLSLFIAISIWNNIYSFFLNGLGIVKMQMTTAIIGALINVPLALFFIKELHLGLAGVVYAMCLSLFMFSVLGPYVTINFFKKNSDG